jgi:hypothetical protein
LSLWQTDVKMKVESFTTVQFLTGVLLNIRDEICPRQICQMPCIEDGILVASVQIVVML